MAEIDAERRKKEIYRVTMVGSAGNFILCAFKFVAGILGHSSAMIADAVHSFSDFATDLVVMICVRISSKPSDKDHDWGHGKYETLATAIIGILLFGVGLGILYDGALKIWDFFHGRELGEPGLIALWAALISIVIKEGLYRYTMITARRVNSKVVEANAWHHRSDAFSSIGTALGIGGAILLGPRWRVLDPVAAVIVSIFIMKVAWRLLLPCIDELLEKSLPEDTEDEIRQAILSFPEVTSPHNLRTRRIGNSAAVEVHIRMDGSMTVSDSHEVTRRIERKIKDLLGDSTFVSIHVEPAKSAQISQ